VNPGGRAPFRVLSGGGGQRVYLEVAGWLYPGGARGGAPEASDPTWRRPRWPFPQTRRGSRQPGQWPSGPRPAGGHGCGRVAAPGSPRGGCPSATVALLSLAVLASGLALRGSAWAGPDADSR